MNRENQPLLKDELVEFEKKLVEFKDFTNNIDHLRSVFENIPKMNKENSKDVNM